MQNQTIEIVGNFDLTGETAGVAEILGELQQFGFHFAWRGPAYPVEPCGVHIDVACGAGANPAAVTLNTVTTSANVYRNRMLDTVMLAADTVTVAVVAVPRLMT